MSDMEQVAVRRMGMSNTKRLSVTGIFAAVSFLLTFIEVSLPIFPPFLKLDFSGIPALLVGFAADPIAGVGVVLVKNLVHLTITHTAGVGELADFLVTGTFVLVASRLYRRRRNRPSALMGMGVGVLGMLLMGGIANKYLIIPFFSKTVMPLESIVDICHKINPLIHDVNTYVLYAVAPFNLLKGVALCAVTYWLYKPLARILHR